MFSTRTAREARSGLTASIAGAAGSLLLLVAALLPWVSLTVLVSLTVDGTDTNEGTIVLVLAVIGGAFAAAALLTRRLALLDGLAAAGAVALITLIYFALRLEESFSSAVAGDDNALDGVSREITSDILQLEAGWYLGMVAAIIMLGAGLYARFSRR